MPFSKHKINEMQKNPQWELSSSCNWCFERIIFFLYFSKYFSKHEIVFGIPNESKYTILFFEDDIAIKWEPI